MGSTQSTWGQSKESTMKSFAFVCLFAAAYAAPAADADAEADPALLYSSLGYGFHHPYTYGAYAPYAVPAVHSAAVKSVVETPAEVKTTVHAAPVVYSGVHHAAVAAPSSTTPPPMSPPPSSTLPATTPTLAALSTLSRGRLMPRLMLMLTLPTTTLDITTPMPTAASGGSTAASPTRPTTVATSGDTTTRVPATVQPFLQQLKS